MSTQFENNTLSLFELLRIEEEEFNKALRNDIEFDALKDIWVKIKSLKLQIETVTQNSSTLNSNLGKYLPGNNL